LNGTVMASEEPRPRNLVDAALRHARRVVIFVIGSTVVLIGVVMLVTPGPALLVIPLGLAILAIEFAWARHLLHRVRAQVDRTLGRAEGTESTPFWRRKRKEQGTDEKQSP
jgi:uncharacterized protein (TIGR02611 family)